MSHLVVVLLSVTQPVPPVAPVRGVVVDGFRAPACQRCAGHRGVTIATTTGTPVRAVTAGVIVFVGQVARVLYVVEDIGRGARVTYGRLESNSMLTATPHVTAPLARIHSQKSCHSRPKYPSQRYC